MQTDPTRSRVLRPCPLPRSKSRAARWAFGPARCRPALVRPLLLALASLLTACGRAPDLVVYTSVDQVHSEQILERVQAATGLNVRVEFDTEASKTVGLVARLREEARAPRCDVFWNNEVANTIALANEGLLAAYDSPMAAEIPEAFRDPERRWTGFAARARVLIVNTEKLGNRPRPAGTQDLLDPTRFPGGAIARPLTGTTLTHLTALEVLWGAERAKTFAEQLVALNRGGQLSLPSGNGPLMTNVGRGDLVWGFTDTDDLRVGQVQGYPVERIVPDQGSADPGLLVIPNTVMVLKTAPHPENARRLIDFLLSKEVEALLAASDSAQIPVRADVPRPAHVLNLEGLRLMPVDWQAVGRQLPAVHERLKGQFLF
jgi:iron(III) transport system substrate-binding protein